MSEIQYREKPELTLRNAATGMTLRIVRSGASTGGELLEMVATYPARSPRPPEHYHPQQSERFEILEGSMRASIDGATRTLRKGDALVVPARARHSMWNPETSPAVVNWQTRPAMRTQEFFTDLFALAAAGRTNPGGRPGLLDLAVLVPRYWQEMRVTRPSPLTQRLLFALLRPVALLLGHGRRPRPRG
jgi:quercetin dioxygenase-like cupin family protein